jgi:sulfate transport system substrate-binding protein
MIKRRYVLAGLISSLSVGLLSTILPTTAQTPQSVELTLVSYNVAKPAYTRIIPEFQKYWKEKTGQTVTFKESYGPTVPQAQSIVSGLEADIFAINTQFGIDLLVDKGFVNPNWAKRLPNNGVPITSVMVLVTRPGNPKGIRSWQDLTRDDIHLVAINPKTSGNARWGVLAGYGPILKAQGKDKAKAYLNGLVKNSRSLVNNGREATDTFIRNRLGDVMVNFENEIIFTNGVIPRDFPYIAPSPNVQVDFPVTVVDRVVDKRGTRKVAEAFTQFLFTPKAQQIYAEVGYRPVDRKVYQQFQKQYQPVQKLYTIADFGGWRRVNSELFAEGGLFDLAQRAAVGR